MFKREGVCETPSPHSALEHEPWCWRSQGLLRRQCGQVGGGTTWAYEVLS